MDQYKLLQESWSGGFDRTEEDKFRRKMFCTETVYLTCQAALRWIN